MSNRGPSVEQGRSRVADGAFLILDPKQVPQRLRRRARQIALIPLVGAEAQKLLEEEQEELSTDEEQLATLVAGGASRKVIARRLGLPLRTVDRRLAELNRRFGVHTKAELALLLARRGF